MKKILIVVSIILLLVVASYGVVGLRVEPTLQDMLNNTVAGNPNMAVSLKSKTSGLFSSRYVYAMSYTLPPQHQNFPTPMNISADVTYDVAHGPLPAGASTPCLAVIDVGFALDPGTSKELLAALETFPELSNTKTRMRLAFDSSVTTDISVPAVSKTVMDPNGAPVTVTFKGATGSLGMSEAGVACSGWFSAPGLTIQDKTASISLEDMRSASDIRRLRPNLWAGTHKFQVRTLAVRGTSGDVFTVKGLVADASLTPRADVLDYAFSVAGVYGMARREPLPLSLGFALRNLDIDAASDVLAMLQHRGMVAETFSRYEKELRANAERLLARSPALEVNATGMEGERQIRLHVDFRTEAMTALPGNPALAAPMIRANADFSGKVQDLIDLICAMAREMKTGPLYSDRCPQDLAAMIEQAAAMGYVRLDTGRLSTTANWDGASLTVNGKPFK